MDWMEGGEMFELDAYGVQPDEDTVAHEFVMSARGAGYIDYEISEKEGLVTGISLRADAEGQPLVFDRDEADSFLSAALKYATYDKDLNKRPINAVKCNLSAALGHYRSAIRASNYSFNHPS